MIINVYSDPGHGWAKVKLALLEKLGIQKQISSYSYVKGEYVYLEEDCDLYSLIVALKEKNIPYILRDHHTNKSSKIRSYESYNNPDYISPYGA